jgi:hypothetical protein
MVRLQERAFQSQCLLICHSYYEIAYTAAVAANERFGIRKGHKALIKELENSSELDFSPKIITEFLEKMIAELPTDDLVTERVGFGQKALAKTKKVFVGVRSFTLRLITVAQAMDPLIQLFLPSSPEYAIPYACLKVLFVVSQIHLQDIASFH